MSNRRKAIPLNVKLTVLHEAGYKCSNPVCRHVLTLDIHHLIYVSVGGPDKPENLLPLCPNCHALYHTGAIPDASVRSWKLLLLALNEAFDRRSVDVLLALDTLGPIKRLTGDGVIGLAPLVAAGMVNIRDHWHETGSGSGYQDSEPMYLAELSEKGKLLVDGWKKGDQAATFSVITPSNPAVTQAAADRVSQA